MAKRILNQAPFPTLNWDKYTWAGECVLPSWKGFQSRRGPYGSIDSDEPSDGSARLSVKPIDMEARSAPTPAQSAAYAHFLANESVVAGDVLRALLSYWQDDSVDFGEDPPKVGDISELRDIVGLTSVHVLNVERDGAAYIGFELGFSWDDEHGGGVMTHLGRIVEAGAADVSFMEWIAERDK